MITKKQIITLTIIPIVIFSVLDLLTTYMGVCVYKGIELNLNAINLAQRFGFIPAGLMYICERSIIGLFLAYFLWINRDEEIARTFVIVTIVLFLTDFANVIVLNVNDLMIQNTGSGFAPKGEHMKDMTTAQIVKVNETFQRKDFCRLI